MTNNVSTKLAYKYEPRNSETVDKVIEIINNMDNNFPRSIEDYSIYYDAVIESGQTLLDLGDKRMTTVVDFLMSNSVRYLSINETYGHLLDFEKYINDLYSLKAVPESIDE